MTLCNDLLCFLCFNVTTCDCVYILDSKHSNLRLQMSQYLVENYSIYFQGSWFDLSLSRILQLESVWEQKQSYTQV